jgi:hypothetical protein
MAAARRQMTVRKKKTVRKTATETFLVNKKYLGTEPPKFDGTQSSLGRALSWHHSMSDNSDAREFATDWLILQGEKALAKKVASIPDVHLPLTSCWRAGLNMNGWTFSPEVLAHIKADLVTAISKAVVVAQPEEKIEKPKASVYDLTLEKINGVIADLEDVIDAQNWDFSMYEYLQKNEIPQKYVAKIIEYYTPLLEEWTLAHKGKEKDLVEGYSWLNKKSLADRVKFLTQSIDDLNRWVDNIKTVRAPRKKKPVSADRKVVRLKFQQTDNELHLESTAPVKLIGASEVWLYNTKYGLLSRYVATDRGGIDVKGQTLINFDPSASIEKRVGRQSSVLTRAVLDSGKIQLRKLMDTVKSKGNEPKGRINTNTILLRVV